MGGLFYVTGSGRCGTSWFGRMLAANCGVSYFHEPFNSDTGDPWGLIASGRVERRPPYNPSREWLLGYLEKAVAVCPEMVVKDFFGLPFVDEIEEMGFRVVVICRHPAPASVSWEASGFPAPGWYDFIGHPNVIGAVRGVMDHIYSRGDLWWRLWMIWAIRYAALRAMGRFDWVTHEELCLNPAGEFDRLALEFNDQGREFFDRHNRQVRQEWVNWKIDRVSALEPFKWFGKFERFSEMCGALEPFGVRGWGLWDDRFWT